MTITLRIWIYLLVYTCASLSNLHAQIPANAKHINADKGIGAGGYDLTVYIIKQKAVKGKSQYSVKHGGITYYFSNAINQKLFEKNPEAYLPEYGGWCAYAMGNSGEKVEVDPETFKIINGKLYLFYNFYFNNTLKSWNKDEPILKKKADTNWLTLNK
ncbi:MAG: YHS domain protein [Bacteroidetes bacterium]|nr:YHS domain protein [Bacteroidota bacterium]